MQRTLRVDVCDYTNTVLCNLYDSTTDASGGAVDVFVITERNGWKELTFTIPSICMDDEGKEERNFRLDYLKGDYRLKAVDDYETDYYLISEPKITHNAFSGNYEVRAGHIAQILKSKSLDLEFSDEEGNNVGTADEILDTILEGSSWKPGYVYPFKEENGDIKYRSLVASAGTGALSLIEKLCDLFEAKPIYHGATRTVDIVPMNPFSEVDAGEIPQEVLDGENVLELHYDRNVHNLSRTINTENMATRLYAYGSYGDQNGLGSIQKCSHNEYYFTAPALTATEFEFQDSYGSHYFFHASDLRRGHILIWSEMDIMSKSYIWNNTLKKAYKIYKKPTGVYQSLTSSRTESVVNRFPYLLSFRYFDEVGLLTDEHRQVIAAFQRDVPELYQISEDASSALIATELELSETAESNTGFLRLDVSGYDNDGGYTKVIINKRNYSDGVIYRTDYDEAERRYFQWHVVKQLKANGDPTSGIGSVLFVVHNTNPVTWDKAYVKAIYDNNGNLYTGSDGAAGDFSYSEETRPGSFTVWANGLVHSASDRVYLFCTNSMSGMLGAKQTEDEAVIETIADSTTDGTEKHNVYFVLSGSAAPSVDQAAATYGWYYKYSPNPAVAGELYFCWGNKGDTAWHRAFVDQTAPGSSINGNYFFNTKYKTLWHGVSGKWVQYKSAAEQRVANMFTKVYYCCRRRDMLYKGLYEIYSRSFSGLAVGNYAIPNDFAFYWTFSTDKIVNGTLKLDTTEMHVYQNGTIDNIVSASATPFDTVFYPVENEFADAAFTLGTINASTGIEVDSSTIYRSSNIKVYEGTTYEYSLPANSAGIFYDVNLNFISSLALTGSSASTGTVTTPAQSRYIRIISSAIPTGYLRVQGYDTKIYLNDKEYTVLSGFTGSGELLGINNLTKKFADLADEAYGNQLQKLVAAQKNIRDRDSALSDLLGDMLRDGRWEDSNYVEGDEDRLYSDAMDMLKEISWPEISYEFTFLDMYGSNHNMHYYEDQEGPEWPDIQITDAAHLVDPDIGINCWAYLDKINKCYDKRWATTIEIDTKLTLASRHEFTDVLARIAEVAKNTKSKQQIYERAKTLGQNGSLPAERLEGMIALSQTVLNGGSSNWYNDDKGNLIFESADGLSAMILGGRGLGIANSKNADGLWEWRQCATGYGLTADAIYTGYLSGAFIEAGTITAEKLMSNVGQTLDIGSNKSLLLFATTNGSRPSGSVLTKSDSLIEIATGNLDNKKEGYINILSGGTITIASGATETMNGTSNVGGTENVSGSLNLLSGGNINIQAGATETMNGTSNVGGNMNIGATGAIKIAAGGTLDLVSGGTFSLRSHGADNINSTADGIYMGNDGVNFGGGKFKVTFNGNTSTVYMNASQISLGSTTLQGTFDTLAKAAEDAQKTADSKAATYRCTSGEIVNKSYRVGDEWINTDNTYYYTYICTSVSNPRNASSDWVLARTAITSGAALNVDAINGTINMVAANSITIAAGATVNIAAGKALTLTSSGNVVVGNSGKPFTFGSNGTNAYLYNGMTTLGSTAQGIYLGTDGFAVGGGKVKITAAGNAYFDGEIHSGTGEIGGWKINASSLTGNLTGLAKTTNDADIAIWAGNATAASANFYVQQNGHLYAKDIEVAGGKMSVGSNFSVDANGKLKASDVEISGAIVATSGSFTGKISSGEGDIGGWKIIQGALYSGNGGTFVKLDSSTDTHPLSGYSETDRDAQWSSYAIWCGADEAQNAPFSVTKDGTVTITKLRVYNGSGYENVDLRSWISSGDSDDEGAFDTSAAMGKLKFQTVKSIRSNSTSGTVTINITDGNGGTSSHSFNTARSVKVSGSWSGSTYTAKPVYANGSATGGDSVSTKYHSTQIDTSTVEVAGNGWYLSFTEKIGFDGTTPSGGGTPSFGHTISVDRMIDCTKIIDALPSVTNCASGLTRDNLGKSRKLYRYDATEDKYYIVGGGKEQYWYYRDTAQTLQTFYKKPE